MHLKLNFQTPLRQEFMLLLLSAAPGSALERRQAESEGGQDVQVSRHGQPARGFAQHSGLAFVWVKSVTGK